MEDDARRAAAPDGIEYSGVSRLDESAINPRVDERPALDPDVVAEGHQINVVSDCGQQRLNRLNICSGGALQQRFEERLIHRAIQEPLLEAPQVLRQVDDPIGEIETDSAVGRLPQSVGRTRHLTDSYNIVRVWPCIGLHVGDGLGTCHMAQL